MKYTDLLTDSNISGDLEGEGKKRRETRSSLTISLTPIAKDALTITILKPMRG